LILKNLLCIAEIRIEVFYKNPFTIEKTHYL